MELQACRVLVLNADYRPLSTYPLSVTSWIEAVKAVFAGKADVVAEYDRVLRSERMSMQAPSVIAMRTYVDMSRPAPLTRRNLFVRDGLRCVYCGERFATSDLTFDHLVPRARGGAGTWENLVSACLPCNQAKGDRSIDQLGVSLKRYPYRPTLAEINQAGLAVGGVDDVHASWRDWLYWMVPLES